MTNEYIDWIEKSIANGHIKCYEYADLQLMQPTERDPSDIVTRVNCKHTNRHFALKSINNEKTTLKEVVNEV